MYQAPTAEKILFESPDVLNTDFLLLSSEEEETDNETAIDDLLNGLL